MLISEQALKEAFEIFCNKGVAGSSSAELLATFCDNILKKGGSEKLSDEAIEETLEKVNLIFFMILFSNLLSLVGVFFFLLFFISFTFLLFGLVFFSSIYCALGNTIPHSKTSHFPFL